MESSKPSEQDIKNREEEKESVQVIEEHAVFKKRKDGKPDKRQKGMCEKRITRKELKKEMDALAEEKKLVAKQLHDEYMKLPQQQIIYPDYSSDIQRLSQQITQLQMELKQQTKHVKQKLRNETDLKLAQMEPTIKSLEQQLQEKQQRTNAVDTKLDKTVKEIVKQNVEKTIVDMYREQQAKKIIKKDPFELFRTTH